jgi:hypothetical protein
VGLAGRGPKLFTCPKCRKAYLGHEPLPDCPACGFDYREREGFRWDVIVYLLSILGLISFLLVSSSYRSLMGGSRSSSLQQTRGDESEKLPGRGRSETFRTPYHEPAR